MWAFRVQLKPSMKTLPSFCKEDIQIAPPHYGVGRRLLHWSDRPLCSGDRPITATASDWHKVKIYLQLQRCGLQLATCI